jgi:hypothetical protein
MHEHRLTRKFTSLQANRREREKCELEKAGDLLEMHQEKSFPTILPQMLRSYE